MVNNKYGRLNTALDTNRNISFFTGKDIEFPIKIRTKEQGDRMSLKGM